jgi:valyl-tRNA synthetase
MIYLIPKAKDSRKEKILAENEEYIKLLCKSEEINYFLPLEDDSCIRTAIKDFDIYIDLKESINVELEIKRIKEEIKKISLELEKSQAKILNPQFISKAPKEIIEKEKNKAADYGNTIDSLEKELDAVKKIKK